MKKSVYYLTRIKCKLCARKNIILVMQERNRYIFLTIVCLLTIIFIQNNLAFWFSPQLKVAFDFDQEKLAAATPNLLIFGLLSLAYLAVFVFGLGQLILLIMRRIQGRRLIYFSQKPGVFSLSETKASKLLFLIIAALALSYGLIGCLASYQLKFSAAVPIILNMALQAIVIVLVFSYLGIKNLGFSFGKKYTIFALRIYSLVLPLILASILFNRFLAQKLGAEQYLNPAIELLFFIKSPLLIWLLAIQVAILGPLAEELFFRGFIYKLIRQRFSFYWSAVAVSILFSLLHRSPDTILPIFILSLSLCYLYEKSQNIYTSFIFHAIFNAVNLSFFLVIKDFL